MTERKLLTEETIIPWVKRKLGAPYMKVELHADHITDAIEEGKRWFTARKGFNKQAVFPVTSAMTTYELPDEVETVRDVVFSGSLASTYTAMLTGGFGTGYNGVDILGGIALRAHGIVVAGYSYPASQSGGVLGAHIQSMQYLEQSADLFGSKLDWRQDGRILRLFPSNGSGLTGHMLLTYSAASFALSSLTDMDHYYVKRYILACCKERLGRVRSKYTAGFPGAQGPTQLDGEALLQEAKDEKEKLEEEIQRAGFPTGFMVG